MSEVEKNSSALLISALQEYKRRAQEGIFEFSFRYEQMYDALSSEDKEEAKRLFRSIECAFFACKSKIKKQEG